MSRSPFSPGVVILGGGAALLLVVLAVGFLLPADWEASASTRLDAPADTVFALLDAPEGWRAWTTWPDSGIVREGPERGAGAAMSWNDAELGRGRFTIAEAVPGERVSYTVEVGDGAMRTAGTLVLAEDDSGVVVSWEERGDLGRNPLMGYWALFMDEAQTAELQKSLDRLGAVVSDSSRTR